MKHTDPLRFFLVLVKIVFLLAVSLVAVGLRAQSGSIAITCPANVVQPSLPGQCGAPVTYALPVAADATGMLPVQRIGGPGSGMYFQAGTSIVVYQSTDAAGNTATCWFAVEVIDAEPPKITCPVDRHVGATGYQCSAALTTIVIGTPVATDNCDLGQPVYNDAPASFPVGQTQVTWTATDQHGLTATCVQTITVSDLQWPTITCPSLLPVEVPPGSCSAAVDFEATAVDNCPGYTVSYNYPPLSAFAPGVTPVIATVTDAAGHSNSCTFAVTVLGKSESCNGVDDDCDGLVDESDQWNEVWHTAAAGGATADTYGASVALDGNYALVGAPLVDVAGKTDAGSVFVYRRDAAWGPAGTLIATDRNTDDAFGHSVALEGDVAVIGAPWDDHSGRVNAGSAYVFQRQPGGNWVQLAKLTAPQPENLAQFGTSVAISGNYIAVGAPYDDGAAPDGGAVYIYKRGTGGAWNLVGKRVATDALPGDLFGFALALDGSVLIVGAPYNDERDNDAGAVYVFYRDQGGIGQWQSVVKRLAADGYSEDHFGYSVAVIGNRAVVGAPEAQGAAGRAYLLERNYGSANGWNEFQILADNNPGAASGQRLGASVALDNEMLMLGAPGTGLSWLWRRADNGVWTSYTQFSATAALAGDGFGAAVAVNDNTVLCGSPGADGATTTDQGAATFFEAGCPPTEFRQEVDSVEPGVRCFPSPFREQLRVEVAANDGEPLHVGVFKALGHAVAVLYDGLYTQDLQLSWQPGGDVPGLYLVRVQCGKRVVVRQVVLM